MNIKRHSINALMLVAMIAALCACSKKRKPSELIIGRWDFIETQELTDGAWTSSELKAPYLASEEFREDGTLIVSYTFDDRVVNEYGKWTLDDDTNEMCASGDGHERKALIGFSGKEDSLYIYYTEFSGENFYEGDEIGSFRDVHVKRKEIDEKN